MQRIEQLVRSAVGYDTARGDQVSVINVRFERDAAAAGVASVGPKLFDFDKNDLMRGAELLVLAAVSALIIFFVVRPLLTTAGGAGGPAAMMQQLIAGPGGSSGGHGGGQMQISYDPQTGEALALPSPGPSEVEQRIDMAKIEGQVRVSSVKSISEFVDKHPDESVSILRTWLHEA